MAEMELIFQHGWAFDPSIWNALAAAAQSDHDGVKCTFGDRGYFGATPVNPTFSAESSTKILVVHSLGTQLTDASNFATADLVVVIGGFVQFHDGSERESKISRTAVRKMLQKLANSPEPVLQEFWLNCGFSAQSSALPTIFDRKYNSALLVTDLERLDKNQLDEQALKASKQVLFLHGREDKIAPIRHAEYLKTVCPEAKQVVHSDASHSLPHEYADWCLNQINQAMLVTGK